MQADPAEGSENLAGSGLRSGRDAVAMRKKGKLVHLTSDDQLSRNPTPIGTPKASLCEVDGKADGAPLAHKRTGKKTNTASRLPWGFRGSFTGYCFLQTLKLCKYVARKFGMKRMERSLHMHLRDSVAGFLGIPPVQSYAKPIFKRVMIRMRDGTELSSLLVIPGPEEEVVRRPTVMLRTPYGTDGQGEAAVMYCERGFNYIAQDTRGRFDSGGDFFPVESEQTDGADTVAWIQEQPWSDGRVGVHGMSYMGMTAFATAGCHDGDLGVRIVVPCMASSSIFSIAFPAERAVALELLALWTFVITEMQKKGYLIGFFLFEAIFNKKIYAGRKIQRIVDEACDVLPLKEIDHALVGHRVGYIQDGLKHPDADMPFWDTRNKLVDLSQDGSVPAALHMIGGWHDFFLEQQFKDLAVARAQGCDARITVGPWAHWDVIKLFGAATRVTLSEYMEHLQAPDESETPRQNTAVASVYVTGANEWRGYAEWPPPATARTWWLSQGGDLCDVPAPCTGGHAVSSYTYDPRDPTPSVGGASFNPFNGGVKDCRAFEKRSDVLSFTMPQLTSSLDLVGSATAHIAFSSDLPSADVVARLCDVHPNGRSFNVCDGYVRLTPSHDQPALVEVSLLATAYRFNKGHSVRLLICSGAHPRISRNLGTCEPLGEGTTMQAGEMRVHHGETLKSSLTLPICNGRFWHIAAP